MKIVTRAIILDQGKVLLGKRMRKDEVGKWALIGGGPEGEESPEETIIREVQEELGVTFIPTFWIEETDNTYGGGETYKVFYFYGPLKGKLNLKVDEVSEVVFVKEADLEKLDIAFNHKEKLKKFFQTIQINY